jgi:hypothetical protein
MSGDIRDPSKTCGTEDRNCTKIDGRAGDNFGDKPRQLRSFIH